MVTTRFRQRPIGASNVSATPLAELVMVDAKAPLGLAVIDAGR